MMENGKLACRAKTLLAVALLMPLAACAAQPAAQLATPAASEGAAIAQAPVAPARQSAAVQAPRQQDATTQDATAPDSTTAPVAPRQGAAAPTRPAASSATGTPARIPPAERATTVGEVPTTTGTTAGTTTAAPDGAGMPAAPAAVPDTPANPARMPQAASGPSAAPSAGSLLQTILALALVLALLAALAWGMKRYGPKMSGNSANLRMVGALNIGGRERIMVVEVGDQWIVVGASPGRVNALATMPRGEGTAGAQGTAALAGHAPSAATFADWLKQTIDKRNAK